MNSASPRLFLSRREAAAACGVSEDTLRRAKEAGRLKAKKTGPKGGKELYSIAALTAWFDSLNDA